MQLVECEFHGVDRCYAAPCTTTVLHRERIEMVAAQLRDLHAWGEAFSIAQQPHVGPSFSSMPLVRIEDVCNDMVRASNEHIKAFPSGAEDRVPPGTGSGSGNGGTP